MAVKVTFTNSVARCVNETEGLSYKEARKLFLTPLLGDKYMFKKRGTAMFIHCEICRVTGYLRV